MTFEPRLGMKTKVGISGSQLLSDFRHFLNHPFLEIALTGLKINLASKSNIFTAIYPVLRHRQYQRDTCSDGHIRETDYTTVTQ